MSDLAAVTMARRTREAFEQVVEAGGEDRERLLAKACGDDDELRLAVERLLAHDQACGDFLERPAIPSGGWPEVGPARAWVGRRLGPYEIRELIGEGGSSTVFRAERSAGDFHRQVAIKLIRAGLESAETVRRLRIEWQILAALDHPHIARLLDAGATDEGIPYVVMEYVSGRPITAWCDERRLELAGRLAIFGSACRAVHFAHQRLVVHRDLKPGNLLVDDDGQLKLVDFGIAKLLAASPFGDDVEPTWTELTALTPGYASPEQLTGGPVTTASDVYSLGVVLYELVSGCRPYRRAGATPAQLADRLERRPPPAPSAALRGAPPAAAAAAAAARGITAGDLARRLAGDLDTIVAKAMFPEPDGRYASVEQLAADVDRHLAGEPVLARAPRLGYRIAKFVRRNRLAVALGAVALAMLVAVAAVAAVKSIALGRERDRAQAALARAEAVTRFLEESFSLADPSASRGASLTARDVLDAGAARADGLAPQPELQASLLHSLADGYRRLGLYDAATPLARRAVELRRRSGASGLADSLDLLTAILLTQRRAAEASPVAAESLALRSQRAGPDDPAVAVSLANLAEVRRLQGDFEAAGEAALRAVEISRRSPGEDARQLAESLHEMGSVLHSAGRLAEAQAAYREALELFRKAADGGSEARWEVGVCLHSLAQLRAQRGDPAEAEDLFRQALAVERQVVGEMHPSVANTLISLAVLYRDQRRWAEAEPLFRQALAIYRTTEGEDDDLVVNALSHLGFMFREKGDLEAAEGYLRQALDLGDRVLPADDLRRGDLLQNLARVQTWRGRRAEAEELARQALAARRQHLGERNARVADSRELLAEVLVDTGRAAEAEPLARQALAAYREVLGSGDFRIAAARSVLGAALAALGRRDEAADLLRTSSEELERLRPGSPWARNARRRLTAFEAQETQPAARSSQ